MAIEGILMDDDDDGASVAHVDMVVDNNGTWEDAFRFGTVGDLTWSFTGMTFHMDVKASRYVSAALFSLTTVNGRIVVDDAVQRTLHFNVPTADIVANLPPAKYVYDLVMIDGSSPAVRVPLMAGHVHIKQGVTRS